MHKLILLMGAIFMMALIACSEQQNHDEHHKMTEKAEAEEAEVTYASWNKVCPIRGEEVDNTVETVTYEGKEYGFCCSGCDEKFAESPETFAKNLSEDGTEFLDSKS